MPINVSLLLVNLFNSKSESENNELNQLNGSAFFILHQHMRLFFLVVLLFGSLVVPAGNSSGITHEHNLYEEIFGDGDNEFVCYNRVHRNFYVSIFIAVAGLLFLAINRYQLKRKAAVALSRKNAEIAEKNKSIIDSINYARRLQNAILPPQEKLQRHLGENFVFYLPKDIVSGDFYWVAESHGRTFLAVADCTGHGVPGAMVSMLGFNGLNHAVAESGDPAQILQILDKYILDGLQKGSSGEVADGMDISLVAIDKVNLKVSFAGAMNDAILVTQKVQIPLVASKNTVGGQSSSKTFTSVDYTVSRGDSLFLFTDGFSDQFGGERGKKFMYKKFISLLNNISSLPSDQQREKLQSAFNQWKGSHEQIDDVLVIGVKF